MSKNLLTKYYQENIERLQKKKVRERYQNLAVVNITKISQKMKNKSLLNIKKYIIE